MITFITHVRVLPANADAFEALLSDVKQKVRQCEPGVLFYDFARSVNESDTYVVIEVYRDQKAHAAHMDSEWIKASIPKSNLLVENGNYEIRQYVSEGTTAVRERMKDLKSL